MTISTSIKPLYDFIFQHSSQGILLVDTDGRFSTLNPAASAMLHVLPDDVIGQTPREAFPRNPLLAKVMEYGGPSPMTLDVPLPKRRMAQITANDLPDKTRIAAMNDVTELRKLESRRDELIRTIAHDLSNPLNAIGGYADLVSKFGEMNDKQKRFLLRIRQTSDKLMEVSSSLLNLAWFEAGMPLEYLPFDMSSLMRSVVRKKTDLAHSKDIKLIVALQDAMPSIMGHPTAIEQSIAHLVDNAIQYSPRNSNVVIHGWQQANEVRCSIADRGIGMSSDELEKIWDRMWRSPRVQHIQGGGIGLTYARLVIERHGGKIWADSHLNKGTVLTFSLPFVEYT